MLLPPPAVNTRPSGNNVASWSRRSTKKLPAALQVLVAGSNNSALLIGKLALLLEPPATNTLPLASSVAVWCARASARLPTALQVLVAGSYNSALARRCGAADIGLTPSPPVTNTLPLASSVAVWNPLATARLPATLHVLLAGSNNSALLKKPPLLTLTTPATTRTLPLASSVAVWLTRAASMRLKVSPGGNPPVRLNVMGVLPLAAKVWLYATPTVPSGGADDVKTGAVCANAEGATMQRISAVRKRRNSRMMGNSF